MAPRVKPKDATMKEPVTKVLLLCYKDLVRRNKKGDIQVEKGGPAWDDGIRCIEAYHSQATRMSPAQQEEMRDAIAGLHYAISPSAVGAPSSHKLYKAQLKKGKVDLESLSWGIFVILYTLYGRTLPDKYIRMIRQTYGSTIIDDFSDEYYAIKGAVPAGPVGKDKATKRQTRQTRLTTETRPEAFEAERREQEEPRAQQETLKEDARAEAVQKELAAIRKRERAAEDAELQRTRRAAEKELLEARAREMLRKAAEDQAAAGPALREGLRKRVYVVPSSSSSEESDDSEFPPAFKRARQKEKASAHVTQASTDDDSRSGATPSPATAAVVSQNPWGSKPPTKPAELRHDSAEEEFCLPATKGSAGCDCKASIKALKDEITTMGGTLREVVEIFSANIEFNVATRRRLLAVVTGADDL